MLARAALALSRVGRGRVASLERLVATAPLAGQVARAKRWRRALRQPARTGNLNDRGSPLARGS